MKPLHRPLLFTIALFMLALPAGAGDNAPSHGGGGGGHHGDGPTVVIVQRPIYNPWYRMSWSHDHWRDEFKDVNTRVAIKIKPKDATVVVDGEVRGQARDLDGYPGYLKLTPGAHHIEIRKEGYQTWHQHVQVVSGQSLRLKHKLKPGSGNENSPDKPASMAQAPSLMVDIDRQDGQGTLLSVNLEPAAASLYLDGRPLERGQAISVDPGEHTLDLFHPDTGAVSVAVKTPEGKTTAVSLSLEAKETAKS